MKPIPRVTTSSCSPATHEGYARLARAISAAQMRGREKGKPLYSLSELSQVHGGHWLVLTGCRKGTVPAALVRDGPAAAARALPISSRCSGRTTSRSSCGITVTRSTPPATTR